MALPECVKPRKYCFQKVTRKGGRASYLYVIDMLEGIGYMQLWTVISMPMKKQ